MITAAELSAIPLFADLTPEQLAFLARAVEDIPLLPGEYAVHEGDERALFVVVDGRVDLTKEINGVDRVIGPRGPGEIYGEVPVMLSMNMPAGCVAVEASRLALVGDGSHRVSLDQVIETMRKTGLDMNVRYKETSLGGLAVNVVEC